MEKFLRQLLVWASKPRGALAWTFKLVSQNIKGDAGGIFPAKDKNFHAVFHSIVDQSPSVGGVFVFKA